jgi:GTP pyrophosphokinase
MTDVLTSPALSQSTPEESFSQWLAKVQSQYPAADLEKFRLAFDASRDFCGDSKTETGESWISHCVAVAQIVCSLNLDEEAVCAALLLPLAGSPDWKEKLAPQIAETYGKDVPTLVSGTWRMNDIQLLPQGVDAAERSQQAENLRKMLLSMVEDIRVVLIKLAERLQTIRVVAYDENCPIRLRIAKEVADLFAPLANRLGVWQLKWELEDLSLRVFAPDEYHKIASLLNESREARETYIKNLVSVLKSELDKAHIKADVSGRPKHIYSIWSKMRRKHVDIEGLYDIRAVRVIVDDIRECYTALGIVHTLWTPIPKEFDDYIAKPKANNYRSLHTAVIGPENKSVEIQIRTWEMHRFSEYGVAAHWRYKEKSYAAAQHQNAAKTEAGFEQKIAWLRQILEWKNLIAEDDEVLSAFKSNLFTDTIYVLTPQGKVIDLPNGATPLDFAYALHSSLGHRCRGARVNGQMTPLNVPLKNGQRVEIATAKQGGPSRDWLNPDAHYVVSHRARSKIRQYFKQQQLEETLTQGRAIVEKELARAGASAVKLEALAQKGGFAKPDDLYAAVSRDEFSSRQLKDLIAAFKASVAAPESAAAKEPEEAQLPAEIAAPKHRVASGANGVLIEGMSDMMTSLARCCKPAPPDPIVGFITRGKGVSIHRANCENLKKIQERNPERVIEAEWGDTKDASFPVDIVVEARARPNLLRDLTEVFSKGHVQMISANMQNKKDQTRLFFTVEIHGIEQLKLTLAAIKEVEGVMSVGRSR